VVILNPHQPRISSPKQGVIYLGMVSGDRIETNSLWPYLKWILSHYFHAGSEKTGMPISDPNNFEIHLIWQSVVGY